MSRRDVSHPQSETTFVQREAADRLQQQKVSGSLGQFSKHSATHREHLVPRMHSDTNINGPKTCSVSDFVTDRSTDAVKLSGRAAELADCAVSWSSASKDQAAQRKHKAANESITPSQHDMSANSSVDGLCYLNCDTWSDFSRSDLKPKQDAGASVNGCQRSGVASDRELPIAGGKNQLRHADVKDRRQRGAHRESVQQFAEDWEEGSGEVTHSEKLHGWPSSGASRHGNLMSLDLFVIVTWLVYHQSVFFFDS